LGNASRPLSSGMVISTMVTSGFLSRAILIRSRPFSVSATTFTSCISSSKARSPARNRAWSSASITLICFILFDSSVIQVSVLFADRGPPCPRASSVQTPAQPLAGLHSRHRPAEKKTLAFVALVRAHEDALRFRLDAFGDHAQAKPLRHGDDRFGK